MTDIADPQPKSSVMPLSRRIGRVAVALTALLVACIGLDMGWSTVLPSLAGAVTSCGST